MFKRRAIFTFIMSCLLFAFPSGFAKDRASANDGKVSAADAQNKGKKNKPSKLKLRKSSDAPSVVMGKKLYSQYQCYDCHSISGKGCDNGFILDDVGAQRSSAFIREHLVDPDKHFDKHPHAFGTDINLMPPQNLEPWEIDNLVEYLKSLKKNKK